MDLSFLVGVAGQSASGCGVFQLVHSLKIVVPLEHLEHLDPVFDFSMPVPGS